MFEEFSVPEINWMCIYDTASRIALLADLHTELSDVYEPEMQEVFECIIAKLETVTDDFSEIEPM